MPRAQQRRANSSPKKARPNSVRKAVRSRSPARKNAPRKLAKKAVRSPSPARKKSSGKPARKAERSPARKNAAEKHTANQVAAIPAVLYHDIYVRLFNAFLAEIRSHEPTTNCTGSVFKSGLWLAYLLKGGHIGSNVCVPSFRSGGYVGAKFDAWAGNGGRLGTPDYNKVLAGMNAGQLILLVNRGRSSSRWKISGLATTNVKSALHRCMNKDMIVVSLVMLPSRSDQFSGHNNALVINNRLKTYERFEPNGGQMNTTRDLDRYLRSRAFRELLPDPKYTFVPSDEVCVSLGPQALAGMPEHCRDGGFCVIFAHMWLHLRVLMPWWTARQVHDLWLTLDSTELLYYVLRYQGWMEEVLGSDMAIPAKVEKLGLNLTQLVSPSVR